jgi:hypothetical protein
MTDIPDNHEFSPEANEAAARIRQEKQGVVPDTELDALAQAEAIKVDFGIEYPTDLLTPTQEEEVTGVRRISRALRGRNHHPVSEQMSRPDGMEGFRRAGIPEDNNEEGGNE